MRLRFGGLFSGGLIFFLGGGGGLLSEFYGMLRTQHLRP